MSTLDKLIRDYRRKFGDWPTFVCLSDPVKVIRRAIKSGKPIKDREDRETETAATIHKLL